ncbi:MAG: hypothetical protein JO316_12030 [Abitibacteriaceae bacterium]|nr:hypothetical protein [Abditibacteriaceae bacterium]MBV9866072.1 hypothetical protein [Abditibacteriaceae bacterium]
MLRKTTDNGSISVPVPLHDTVKVGTLGSIIQVAQLPRDLFES